MMRIYLNINLIFMSPFNDKIWQLLIQSTAVSLRSTKYFFSTFELIVFPVFVFPRLLMHSHADIFRHSLQLCSAERLSYVSSLSSYQWTDSSSSPFPWHLQTPSPYRYQDMKPQTLFPQMVSVVLGSIAPMHFCSNVHRIKFGDKRERNILWCFFSCFFLQLVFPDFHVSQKKKWGQEILSK